MSLVDLVFNALKYLWPVEEPQPVYHEDKEPIFHLSNRLNSTQVCLDEISASKLRSLVPFSKRLSYEWRLIYSLDQHGASLQTLYRNCEQDVQNGLVQPRGFILCCCDANGVRFGAYLSDYPRISNSFYGTGDTFVFRLRNDVECYHSTGNNNYYIFGTKDYFALGASNGHFALCLTCDSCSSSKCDTFNNDVLSNSMLLSFEIWGFVL